MTPPAERLVSFADATPDFLRRLIGALHSDPRAWKRLPTGQFRADPVNVTRR